VSGTARAVVVGSLDQDDPAHIAALCSREPRSVVRLPSPHEVDQNLWLLRHAYKNGAVSEWLPEERR
jgi:hypothetical protein